MDAVYAAGILGLIALVLWAATRQNEIFRLAIRAGRVTVVRGKVPPSFLSDLRELPTKEPSFEQFDQPGAGLNDGTVHAVKSGGEARLVFSSSIDERTAQRLRNAFALYPAAKRL